MRANPADQVVLWDFDGTLGESAGVWGGAMLRVLDEHEPGHSVRKEQIRPHLQEGFPWHNPEEPHLHLSTPESWWTVVEGVLSRAYEQVGFERRRAAALARLAHEKYIDPRRFRLYEDTLPALRYLRDRGWGHAILSNHVPELSQIVACLGLSPLVRACVSSGTIGYEKPHPEAYRTALEVVGNPEQVWMVGDNAVADVAGAEAVGIKAIQVRSPRGEGVIRYAADLMEAARLIEPDA